MSSRNRFGRFRRSSFTNATVSSPQSVEGSDIHKYREEKLLTELHPDLLIHEDLPVFLNSPNTSNAIQYDSDSDGVIRKSWRMSKKRKFSVFKIPTCDLDSTVMPTKEPAFQHLSLSYTPDNLTDQLSAIGYHHDIGKLMGKDLGPYYRHITDEQFIEAFIPEERSDADAQNDILPGFSEGTRVEYDMDKTDYEFLKSFNKRRRQAARQPSISKEIFETTMTLLELAWFWVEQRMPPRTKFKVTNEIPDAEDQKCVICDDGECDNNNVIVFCDGCDIAVHQDCYGVPFIPEGQWLCKACQASRTKLVACLFCPNRSGVFKKTDTGEWVHLICSIWLPEVSIPNNIFVEPVTGVENIDRNRWRLTCFICKQKMGACIQCSNKKCSQAYHPTCGRKARLYMKMTAGIHDALVDQSTVISFCDRHTPVDYEPKVSVKKTVALAKAYYRQRDAQASTKNFDNDNNLHENNMHKGYSENWKTRRGIALVPAFIANRIVTALAKFEITECTAFVNEMCRYWVLKKEHLKGAYLLKRLQNCVPSESFTLTSRHGPLFEEDRIVLEARAEELEAQLRFLGQLRLQAKELYDIETRKLEVAERHEALVISQLYPFMKAVRFIWTNVCELDHKLVLLTNKSENTNAVPSTSTNEHRDSHTTTQPSTSKKVITTLTGSARGKEISKKIDTYQYSSLNEFRTDVISLFEPPHITRYTYIGAHVAAGAKVIIGRLIEQASRDCKLETDRYMPEFCVLLPDTRPQQQKSQLRKQVQTDQRIQSNPAIGTAVAHNESLKRKFKKQMSRKDSTPHKKRKEKESHDQASSLVEDLQTKKHESGSSKTVVQAQLFDTSDGGITSQRF